jgi:hypothetical protein
MFYLIFLLVAVLGMFTYLMLPKGTQRLYGVLFYLAVSTGVFFTSFEMLGSAKPVYLEWQSMKALRIVYMRFDKERGAVYMVVLRDGLPTLYQYTYPDKKDAEALEDKWRKGALGDLDFFTEVEGDSAQVNPEPVLPPK